MSVVPDIQATRCVRYRFRYSTCRRCEQVCPHQAVKLSDEGVAIATERCKGCGLCVSACRTETFTAESLSALGLIERARGRSSYSVACAPSGAEADSVVPCLGALGPALLAYLVKQGVELNMVGSDHCPRCAHGACGSEQLGLNLDAVESLRVADREAQWAGISLPVRKSDAATQGDERRASRRRFFRSIAGSGDGAARSARQPPGPSAPLRAIRAARVAPSAQRDLLQLLGLAQAPAPIVVHPSLPVGDIGLEPGCTGCEACARSCPSGALQVRENSTAWALGFEAALCVGCAVCTEACQPRVLRLREMVAAASFGQRETLALRGLPKRRCTRCDRSFIGATDSALCDVCAGDVEDFDAIFG